MEKVIVNDYFVEIVDNKLIVTDSDGMIVNVVTYLNKLSEVTNEPIGLYFGSLVVLFRLNKSNKESFALLKIKGDGRMLLGDDVYEERVSLLNNPLYNQIVENIDNGRVVYMQHGNIVYTTYENGELDLKKPFNNNDCHYSFAKRRILRPDIKDLFDVCGIDYDKNRNYYRYLTVDNIYKIATKFPYVNTGYLESIFSKVDCYKINELRLHLRNLYIHITKIYKEGLKFGDTPQFIQYIRNELKRFGLDDVCKYVDYDLNATLKKLSLKDFKAFLERVQESNDNYMFKITNGEIYG